MMKSEGSKILCFGEVLWDMLPTGEKPGGAPMNVALHLKNFGLDVAMVSKTGNDEHGRMLIEFMRGSGLNTDLIFKDEMLETSKVLVHIDGQHASFEICEPVAWDNITLSDELVQIADGCNYIVYGSLASRNIKTRKTLQNLLRKDMIKIMDVNLRPPYTDSEVIIPLLKKADILKLNDEEIMTIGSWFNQNDTIPQLMKWIAKEMELKAVSVTRGEQGALLYQNGRLYVHKGYKVNAFDPVGAGDAFLAGYIYSLISEKVPEESLDYACATGALVASKNGATPSYSQLEIENIRQ
ncbi:carbohydrate kinase [Saccharicrinis sp. FJH62]|uniref:carbohydrate kinase family protein n=1 Tax=Saccharicrinis sp. FJH62 TaxID=3344657 RepID=UPI0035D4D3C4